MDWPCSAGLRFVYVRLMISLLTPCSKPRQESIATPPSVLAVDADVAIKVDGCLQGPSQGHSVYLSRHKSILTALHPTLATLLALFASLICRR
ncbi:unnamed protein product [Jaminaea pallidilutea]